MKYTEVVGDPVKKVISIQMHFNIYVI